MRLEAEFRKVINSYFNSIISTFLTLGRNKLPLNVRSRFDERLQSILVTQYLRVEKVFDHLMRDKLPKEIASTVEEDRIISNSLKRFNEVRSHLQSRNINETTQKQITESMALANMVDTDTQEIVDGRVVDKKQNFVGFELFLSAGEILKRKLLGRISGIVNTETQVPAEVSKLTETEVLSGITPSVISSRVAEIPVTKVWVSQGDSAVRRTHLAADGQRRKANTAFFVGGFRLQIPGDSSLGAPAKETVNCRCDAQYNTNDLIRVRFEKADIEALQGAGII